MIPVLAQAQPLTPGDLPDVAWSGLVPLLILSGAAVLLLTVMSIARDRLPSWFAMLWTFAAALATIVASIPLWIRVQDVERGAFSTLGSAYGIDGFSVFATMLLAAGLALVALLADDYLEREGLARVEFHVLAMLSVAGGIVMASANDLIVLFLGLEILSLAVYVLAAMHRRRIQSQEAGLKYFVLGACRRRSCSTASRWCTGPPVRRTSSRSRPSSPSSSSPRTCCCWPGSRCSSSASGSRSPPCRSTAGHPTCIRGLPHRSWPTWPRA